MAYHKIFLPGASIPAGINRGLAFVENKLYFFGGFEGQSYNNELLIFNLKSNSFETFIELSLSNKPSMRHYHFMLSFGSNYFFIYGGIFKDQIFDDSFLFNTSTYNWEKIVESQGPGKRYGACGTLVGKFVYIFAGFGGQESEENLSDVWTFDYKTREWASFHTLGNDRPGGVGWNCVAVKNQILCVGTDVNRILILDVLSREWKKNNINGAIPGKLERYSFSRNESGSIFLFGGLNLKSPSNEMYTLEQAGGDYTWHKLECTGNKPVARYSHSTVCLGDILLIVGGRNETNFLNDIFAFNPNLGLRWLTLTSHGEIPPDRVGHISHYIESTGQILIHGGDSRGKVSNDLFLFDYKSHEWKKAQYKGESPALAYHSSVFDQKNLKLIIFGGGDLKNCFSSIYFLNLPELEWTQIRARKALPARAGHNSFLDNEGKHMIIFAGFVPNEGYSNEVWKFNLDHPQWESVNFGSVSGEVPVGRVSASCTVYKNFAYIVGGANAGVVLNDLWKLNLDDWVWERITIYEKTPGSIYGHSATLIDSHVFMLTADSIDSNGNILNKPPNSMLWSLNLGDTIEWSMYKVEGTIPPKRFSTTVLVTNDIVVYGGGPDSNVYQLDRNDVDSDAISCDLHKDFILPYNHDIDDAVNSDFSEEEKFQEFHGIDLLSKASKISKGSKGSKASSSKHSKFSNESQVRSLESNQKVKLIPGRKKLL